jgi:hypothetical protein
VLPADGDPTARSSEARPPNRRSFVVEQLRVEGDHHHGDDEQCSAQGNEDRGGKTRIASVDVETAE